MLKYISFGLLLFIYIYVLCIVIGFSLFDEVFVVCLETDSCTFAADYIGSSPSFGGVSAISVLTGILIAVQHFTVGAISSSQSVLNWRFDE